LVRGILTVVSRSLGVVLGVWGPGAGASIVEA